MRLIVVVAALAGCAPHPRPRAQTHAPAPVAPRTASVSAPLEMESHEMDGAFLVVPRRPEFESMTRKPDEVTSTEMRTLEDAVGRGEADGGRLVGGR